MIMDVVITSRLQGLRAGALQALAREDELLGTSWRRSVRIALRVCRACQEHSYGAPRAIAKGSLV